MTREKIRDHSIPQKNDEPDRISFHFFEIIGNYGRKTRLKRSSYFQDLAQHWKFTDHGTSFRTEKLWIGKFQSWSTKHMSYSRRSQLYIAKQKLFDDPSLHFWQNDSSKNQFEKITFLLMAPRRAWECPRDRCFGHKEEHVISHCCLKIFRSFPRIFSKSLSPLVENIAFFSSKF